MQERAGEILPKDNHRIQILQRVHDVGLSDPGAICTSAGRDCKVIQSRRMDLAEGEG